MVPKKYKAKSTEQMVNNRLVLQSILNRRPSHTDPMGSYTGLPLEEYSKPVQDADDL